MNVDLSLFTKTQRCMLLTLADGGPHPIMQLHACLPDNLGAIANARKHLSEIRRKLRPLGQDILCVIYNRKPHYQWVRLLEAVA